MTPLAWVGVAALVVLFALLAAGAFAPLPNDPEEREE